MTDNGAPIRRKSGGLQTVTVHARGEDFRIVQLQGNLFVCSKENGNCCCGWTEKDRPPVNRGLYEEEWERRKIRNKMHLTFTGCLGPCAVGNNALLQLSGRSIWFKDMNDDHLIPVMFDYIQTLLDDSQAPLPSQLIPHVYARYVPAQADNLLSVASPDEAGPSGMEGLDPVCLMAVDPATARWKSEYAGQVFAFCAPGCKKAFEADPLVYV